MSANGVPPKPEAGSGPSGPLARSGQDALEDPGRLDALARTGLDSVADPRFDRVAHLARRLLGVPLALVSLVEVKRQFFPGQSGLSGVDADARETDISRSLCRFVVESGRPFVVADTLADPMTRTSRAVVEDDIGSYAGVPVTDDDGHVLGALCAVERAPRVWTEDDVTLLAELAELCSAELRLKILHGRPPADDGDALAALSVDELQDVHRFTAEALQRSLLTDLPREPLPGVRLAGLYRPATEALQVGGDWYDAFLLPTGRAALVVGDVAGHDVTAAAIMGQLRTLLRGVAFHEHGSPSEVLAHVDRASVGLSLDALATCVYAEVERRPDGGLRLHLSNAGHLPPLIVCSDGSTASLAARDADLLLGFAADGLRQDLSRPLSSGDLVLMFSDGLVETREESLERGLARLHAVAAAARGTEDLDAFCAHVVSELTGDDRRDDVALLALRVS
nr:GAF domain-containing SpoIIE family protein phosphatase [Motilibacter deserti]